jgi:hypothetical protein
MRVTRFLVLLLLAGAVASCAYLFKGKLENVSFASQPAGAEVFVNGVLKGVTPVVLELDAGEEYTIELRRDGYAPEVVRLNNHIGIGWIIVDILFWPGAIVDAATGSWYTFDKESIETVLSNQQPGGVATSPTVAAQTEPPPAKVDVNLDNLQRHRIKADKIRCAAMPLQAVSVDKDMVKVIDDFVLSELQQAGFEAIGTDDISVMLGFEKTKEAVGCDDASCAAEIGGALGVDYLVAGKVSTLGKSRVVTLKLVDVRNTKVMARSNRTAEGTESALPGLVAQAVQELVTRSGL